MSGIVVDGLRWEVRSRGQRRARCCCSTASPGRGTSWGAHATRVRPALPRHQRRPPGSRPLGHPGRPRPRERRADRRRPGVDPRRAEGWRRPHVLGYSLGRADRAAARDRPSRARSGASCSRARRPASPTGRRAPRPARRRRGPRRRGSSGTGSTAFVDEWEREPVFASQAGAARAPRPRASAPSACATGRPGSPPACAGPGRARWSRSTTAWRRSRRRRSSSPAPSTRPAGAGPRSVAAGIPGARLEVVAGGRPRPAPRDAQRPSARSSLAFLEEDPAA